MARNYLQSLIGAFLGFLFLLPGKVALSAPLMVDILLLREPNKRGFLTFFDVALIMLLVAAIFRLKKYSN